MVDKIEEAKATAEDSMSADAVVGAGGPVKKRRADLMKKVDPTIDNIEDDVKTPNGPGSGGIKEAIEELFDDKDLTEDFKENLTTIFEAAFHEKTRNLREELEAEYEAEYEAKLEEEAATLTESLETKLDSYLDYVVENWKEENKIELEAGYKVAMAESLFHSLKSIMEEHNFDLDEETDATLKSMEEAVSDTEAKFNDLFEDYTALKTELVSLKKSSALAEVSEGLIATDADRLKVLSESVEFTDPTKYLAKLTSIKEAYFSESRKTPADETEMLNEEIEEKTQPSNPSVAAYVSDLNKYGKR